VLEAGLLSEADIKTLEKEINDRVDDAMTFADASPEPPEDWLMSDVYKEG
jgi:pyruvate dehydrogenase E1 component alpha subunit